MKHNTREYTVYKYNNNNNIYYIIIIIIIWLLYKYR